ncbi:MAG: hypothetical protein ACRBDX_05310 [Gammaproteobacteria bacterium]
MKTERRTIARYRAKLAVQIEMDDYCFDAISKEVSLRGLRIICEGSTANRIFNRYIQVTPGANITADIQIKTTNATGLTDTLCCRTRVISVSRISQSSYEVGFNIIEFEDNDHESWQDYISTKH